MPSKDPEKRKEVQAAWRKRVYTPAYMKWLYARRKLYVDKAKMFEDVLEHIAKGDIAQEFGVYAAETLLMAENMEAAVGNRFDFENDKPYWKEEA